MPRPRTKCLRIIQEVHKAWQKIYASRVDRESEIANYDMIIEAIKKAEAERDASHSSEVLKEKSYEILIYSHNLSDAVATIGS